MNDDELDDVLNGWKAPEPSVLMRERARGGFRARFRGDTKTPLARRWLGSFAPRLGAIAALLAVVIVLSKAAPLVLSNPAAAVNAPYFMETENSVYDDDGRATVQVFSAAYDKDGREIPYSRSVPDDMLGTIGTRLSELHRAMFVYFHGEPIHEGGPSAAALRSAGCAVEPVVARETILDHPTVAVRIGVEAGRRRTVWLAPGLGCLELKYTSEVERADGTFRLVKRSEAVKVTANKAAGV